MTMTKSLTKLGVVALLISAVGCSVMVRSPEKYREDTRAVIETRRPDIEACYTNGLKGTQDMAGRVSVMFSVQPETGLITDVRVDEAQTTAPEPLAQCVVDSINGLQLTPPDEKEGQATFYFDFVAQPAAG
jgi:hypothetical protein